MLRKIGTFNYALFLPLVSIAVQLQISSNVASVRCKCMLYVHAVRAGDYRNTPKAINAGI